MIDAYVSGLNMSNLEFKYANTKQTGRSPYDPRAMLKLYIRLYEPRSLVHTRKDTEKKISEYMNEIELNDNIEKANEKIDNVRVSEILEHLKNKKEILSEWLKKIEENDGKKISTVDPDAHLMHTNGDGRNLDACYNVQTVVDSKHKLIVDFEVTTCADDKKHFKYDAESDSYVCPNGQTLPFLQPKNGDNDEGRRYYFNTQACKNCPDREKCTTNKRGGRHVNRSPHQDALDRNNAKMAENYDIFKERKKIVEHPFGTTKAVWGYKQYLCRGKSERPPSSRSCSWRTIYVGLLTFLRKTVGV
ncbi:hypothetical protein FACS18949_03210 [Clostridia bacterium]|nr:hypothetical protein FACS18949_03210 [Clostridia bacterium]